MKQSLKSQTKMIFQLIISVFFFISSASAELSCNHTLDAPYVISNRHVAVSLDQLTNDQFSLFGSYHVVSLVDPKRNQSFQMGAIFQTENLEIKVNQLIYPFRSYSSDLILRGKIIHHNGTYLFEVEELRAAPKPRDFGDNGSKVISIDRS